MMNNGIMACSLCAVLCLGIVLSGEVFATDEGQTPDFGGSGDYVTIPEGYTGMMPEGEMAIGTLVPSTIYVDHEAPGYDTGESWLDAFHELSDALDLAATHPEVETICLAQGTWVPVSAMGNRQATFPLRGNLVLLGGYAGNACPFPNDRNPDTYITMLSGDVLEDDNEDGSGMAENVYNVVSAVQCSGPVTLDGLTISGGNANGVNDSEQGGGGLYCENTQLTLNHCHFEQNHALYYGGGVLLAGFLDGSDVEISECVFTGNTAKYGGGLSAGDGESLRLSLVVNRCEFDQNHAIDHTFTYFGGGAFYTSGSGSAESGYHEIVIEESTFTSNTASTGEACGGAALIDMANSCVFRRCLFSGNELLGNMIHGSGIAFNAGLPLSPEHLFAVEDCSFDRNSIYGNSGSTGSAISNDSTDLAITGCKFTFNRCQSNAAYVIDASGRTFIDRCICHNNQGSRTGIHVSGDEQVIRNCLIANNGGFGISLRGTLDLINSTIVDNRGQGVVSSWNAECNVYNSIIYGNAPEFTESQFTYQLGRDSENGNAQYFVWNSCIDHLRFDLAGYSLTRCFLTDPVFDNPLGADGYPGSGDEDYRLAEESPCINRGDYTASIAVGNIDVEGAVRVRECIVDVGAYESEYWNDCNGNSNPDSCDVVQGGSCDVNANTVPDECETDCNGNGQSDNMDIDQGLSQDCNWNAYPDECDIAQGGSADCNLNDIPDECEMDCNGNGTPDDCDILDGMSVDADSNGVPDECQDVWFVDDDASTGGDGTSWQTAFRFLQDALVVAGPADRICVADGLYLPDQSEYGNTIPGLRRETFMMPEGVLLAGGFPGLDDPSVLELDERDFSLHESILSGDLAGDDGDGFLNMEENSYNVVRAEDISSETILDGFTISQGNADDVESDDNSLRRGAGVYLEDAPIVVRNCYFTANSAAHYGAGIMVVDHNDAVVTDCIFRYNRAYSGGGISTREYSNPWITNCLFHRNIATYAGGAFYSRDNGNPTICNCTIVENEGTSFAGALYSFRAYPVVLNSIIWGNVAPTGLQIRDNQSTTTVNYSNIQDGWPGNNMQLDPLFRNVTAWDFRLSKMSPCIDAGNNDYLPDYLEFDLSGLPRIVSDPLPPNSISGVPIVDMGAYEFRCVRPSN